MKVLISDENEKAGWWEKLGGGAWLGGGLLHGAAASSVALCKDTHMPVAALSCL